jgi:hypothetical protein
MSFGDLTVDRMSRHLFIESNQTKEVFFIEIPSKTCGLYYYDNLSQMLYNSLRP